jgi:hypothetical protein
MVENGPPGSEKGKERPDGQHSDDGEEAYNDKGQKKSIRGKALHTMAVPLSDCPAYRRGGTHPQPLGDAAYDKNNGKGKTEGSKLILPKAPHKIGIGQIIGNHSENTEDHGDGQTQEGWPDGTFRKNRLVG